MRLGPEHRPDLVDPLEDADQHLLVELRALGEVRRAAEVVDLEDVRARLGRRLDQLGGVHLGEAGGVQGGPEPVQARRRQLPHRAPARVSPCRRGLVEQGRQPGVERGAPELDRRGVRRVAEGGDPRRGDLHTAGSLRVRGRRTDHLDRRLLRGQRLPVPDHDLCQAGPVADDQEGDRRELAAAVHPALQADWCAGDGVRELAGHRAARRLGRRSTEHAGWWTTHRNLQVTGALEVWAGARSRCHHTFADDLMLLPASWSACALTRVVRPHARRVNRRSRGAATRPSSGPGAARS